MKTNKLRQWGYVVAVIVVGVALIAGGIYIGKKLAQLINGMDRDVGNSGNPTNIVSVSNSPGVISQRPPIYVATGRVFSGEGDEDPDPFSDDDDAGDGAVDSRRAFRMEEGPHD